MGKVPVDRERFTMVVIIGRTVAETWFKRKVGIGSRSHRLSGGLQKLSDFINRLQEGMIVRLGVRRGLE